MDLAFFNLGVAPEVFDIAWRAAQFMGVFGTDLFGERITEEEVSLEILQHLRNGTAGEHIVCADLLRRGLEAFIVAGNRAYDIVVEAPTGLFRLQVKTCLRPTVSGKYHWGKSEKKGSGKGRVGGLVSYRGAVDGLALVALDIRRIRYVHIDAVDTVHISVSPREMETQEELSWRALATKWGCYRPELRVVNEGEE